MTQKGLQAKDKCQCQLSQKSNSVEVTNSVISNERQWGEITHIAQPKHDIISILLYRLIPRQCLYQYLACATSQSVRKSTSFRSDQFGHFERATVRRNHTYNSSKTWTVPFTSQQTHTSPVPLPILSVCDFSIGAKKHLMSKWPLQLWPWGRNRRFTNTPKIDKVMS